MSSKKARTGKKRNKGQGKNKTKDRSRNRRSRPQGRSGRRPRSAASRPRKPSRPSPAPVVEEPLVEEPLVEEPLVETPVVLEPVAAGPVGHQPPPRRPRSVVVTTVPGPKGMRPRLTGVGRVGLLLLLCAGALMAWIPILRHSDGNGSGTPGSSSYIPPTPVPAGSAYVRTEVLAGGRLRVTHWIHTSRPQDVVRLGFPSGAGPIKDSLSVSHVVLAADGERVAAPSTWHGPTEDLPIAGARRIYVSYVLSGVIERSAEQPGRALARPASLEVSTQEPAIRTVHTVGGAAVLALACSANRARALPRPCGTVKGGSWMVDLRRSHADDSVMAQFDLG